ncbi:L-2-amino-thiazoline-4-carboxylic acid hydrolase [Consotaella salsifontis]|uniref:L-2-amino-thiazoline-4-carboxylic acid hydrolase n=1 Tax=Consotaella salsifontis TaxID=1365950 RepID=A0A1T4T290_9HYPH|nr:L-2-amino-thiazoline-4-carboxylic acid hydrolase [Consotaella salsifontis]SKA34624.1 L-2-amino-thiazoline-4-carboxylic acid hydrolase [Consotaella salsifontis]
MPDHDEKPRTAAAPMPILDQRRIEASVLRQVYDVLAASHGEDVARRTIDEAVSRAAVAQGEAFRQELGRDPDLADFSDILPRWTANGALEIDVLHADPKRLDFNVRRCRYAEMYRAMGLGHLGAVLSCNRDGRFCEGYNPAIEFSRTQTLMEGADHCDFRYRLSSPKQS